MYTGLASIPTQILLDDPYATSQPVPHFCDIMYLISP